MCWWVRCHRCSTDDNKGQCISWWWLVALHILVVKSDLESRDSRGTTLWPSLLTEAPHSHLLSIPISIPLVTPAWHTNTRT